MEGPESKGRKVFNKKNDLLAKIQTKIKRKGKKKIKRNEKKDKRFNGIRQLRNGVPELGRPRAKCAPGHEGMFLKGLRTQYISRETLNEANEARKNEDINKIIDIGRVFQKKGEKTGGRKRTLNLNSAPDNPKSEKMTAKDLTMASMDFDRCSLSAISTETIEQPVHGTDATIILHENDTGEKKPTKKLNFDKELVMFSLLYEERVGSHLLGRLSGNDVLEEALSELRNTRDKDKFKKDETIELVKEFKFLSKNSEPEMPLEIFREDFPCRNYARDTGNQSSEAFMGFMEKPAEVKLINLSGMGNSENDPVFVPLFDEEQPQSSNYQTNEFEKPMTDVNTPFPPIQFYRRNMF